LSGRRETVNIVFAGLGGQGVLKASDIAIDAAFRCGFDVKKSEVHGMSQRGGFVTSDVRYGKQVYSPMVAPGEADYVVLLDASQSDASRAYLRAGGVMIEPGDIAGVRLASSKSFNVAMLGVLSRHLDIPEAEWLAAIRANLPEKTHEANIRAFQAGRATIGAVS
jgi:indolepyruvate ferredoxin oxidoreductase, beta subunit